MSTQEPRRWPLFKRWRAFHGNGGTLGVYACLLAIGLCLATLSGANAAAMSAATEKLFQAVQVNDMPGVKAAIHDGADLSAKNAAGKTAADIAVDKGHFIIAHFLLSERSVAAKKKQERSVAARKKQERSVAARKAKPRTVPKKSQTAVPKSLAPRRLQSKRTPKRVAQPLVGKRAYPMPPRKPSGSAKPPKRQISRKYALPPRKPLAPLPSAAEVAATPGLKSGNQDDLSLDKDLESEQEDVELPDSPDAEDAEPKAQTTAQPSGEQGPVGRFFQSLLDLVRPDDAPPAPKSPVTSPRKKPIESVASQPTTRKPSAGPQESDSEDTSELPDIGEKETAELPDLGENESEAKDEELPGAELPDADSKSESDVTDEKSIDDELNELERMAEAEEPDPTPAAKPVAPKSSAKAAQIAPKPSVRRIGPKANAVQKAQPVTPAPRAKSKPPASSAAGRTLDRLAGLVKEKPREDEFGLPIIELPDEGPGNDSPGDAPIGKDSDDETPESLLAGLDEEPDDKIDGDAPETDVAPAPGAQRLPPVQALPAPRRVSPRYQSTLDRLRRLGEAVSREIKVDPNSILATGRQAREKRLAEAPAGANLGTLPSERLPVGTGKVRERETSTSRIIRRLEGIRREAYDEEGTNGPTPTAKPRKLPLPNAANQALAGTESEEPGVVSALARFFRSGRGRKEGKGPEKSQLNRGYQRAPDQGRAAAATDTPPSQLMPRATDAKLEEPKAGQKAGRMTPGILENLSRMFTDKEQKNSAWAADVEIVGPDTGASSTGATAPMMTRPVPSEENAALAAPAPSLPPPGDAKPGAWTTTVEMTTETGEPMVLGVTKTPESVRTRTAAVAPKPAAAANEKELAELPEPKGETEDPLSDLPVPKGEASEDPLGDLPPAEGEEKETPEDPLGDLPPAEGEEKEAAPASDDKPAKKKIAKPRRKLPYSDPLRAPAPEPKTAATAPRSTLSRAGTLKPGPTEPRQPEGKLKLTPEERLATAKSGALPTQGQVAARQQSKSASPWPVTNLAKNDSRPAINRRPRPAMLSRTSLTGVNFTLGESVSLENSLPPDDGVDADNQCVKKNRGTTLFCIEPVDWPENLSPKFVVPTILYTGTMAIIRYDQGMASRLHALFPSAEFDTVAQFYQSRYGEPTEIWKRSIAPLAEPRRDNPTLAWRSRDPKTNAVTILELRQYDDTRGGFPDTSRGAVMLYMANSPAIFPQVSSHELMRLKRDQQKKPG